MSRRALRRALGRLLPEAVKAPLRKRLFGYRPSPVDLGLLLREADDGLLAVEAGGVRFRAPAAARGDVLYHFRDNGASVEEMHALLRAAREVGGTLMDVGAARGLLSAAFCLARDGNRALAYEPSPAMAEDARALAAANGLREWMEVLPDALGSQAGRLGARVAPVGVVDFTEDAPDFFVRMTTVDAECERLGADPEVLKIDVEGAEHDVLLGAASLLARRKPLLLLELHLDLLERRGRAAREVVEMLLARGYRLESCLGRPLSPAAVYDAPDAIVRCVAR